MVQAPPTVQGNLSENQIVKAKWANVIGTIAILSAGLAIVSSLCGLLGTIIQIVTFKFMTNMSQGVADSNTVNFSQFMESVQPTLFMSISQCLTQLMVLSLSVYLIFPAIKLINHKPEAKLGFLRWAKLAMLTVAIIILTVTPASISMQKKVAAAQSQMIQQGIASGQSNRSPVQSVNPVANNASMPASTTNTPSASAIPQSFASAQILFAVLGMVLHVALLSAFPLFCLFWFKRPNVLEEVARWETN